MNIWHPCFTDVSQADPVEEPARKTLETFSAVHVLCNNAGGGSSWEMPLAGWKWKSIRS
jgi:hypothetical protein